MNYEDRFVVDPVILSRPPITALHLYLKTEKSIRLKLNREVGDFAMAFPRKLLHLF